MEIKDITNLMTSFVTEKGWYLKNSPRPQTPRNIAMSLSIEVGEILEHFQWADQPKDTEALSEELADVLLYLLQLASVLSIDIEKATITKLQKNRNRKWR
jgi:NTP pyrophosphatase (non-canonical NTP hydrolase)